MSRTRATSHRSSGYSTSPPCGAEFMTPRTSAKERTNSSGHDDAHFTMLRPSTGATDSGSSPNQYTLRISSSPNFAPTARAKSGPAPAYDALPNIAVRPSSRAASRTAASTARPTPRRRSPPDPPTSLRRGHLDVDVQPERLRAFEPVGLGQTEHTGARVIPGREPPHRPMRAGVAGDLCDVGKRRDRLCGMQVVPRGRRTHLPRRDVGVGHGGWVDQFDVHRRCLTGYVGLARTVFLALGDNPVDQVAQWTFQVCAAKPGPPAVDAQLELEVVVMAASDADQK